MHDESQLRQPLALSVIECSRSHDLSRKEAQSSGRKTAGPFDDKTPIIVQKSGVIQKRQRTKSAQSNLLDVDVEAGRMLRSCG